MVWPRQRSALENRQATSQFVARLIPLILIGVVGYATWVVIVTLCANYLLNTSNGQRPLRTGAAVGIMVVYFILLFPVATSYFRILYTTFFHPGYVPTGTADGASLEKIWEPEQQTEVQRSCTTTKVAEKPANPSTPTTQFGQHVTRLEKDKILDGEVPPPPGLEQFYTKEVFVCDADGLPRWCGICNTWKPDRSHHCSDVGRCVRKLDHFCPWVGGVVSETNFKFFILFNCYAALFAAFVMIAMAFFVAEVKSGHHSLNANWAVLLGLAAFFLLFTFSMAARSIGATLQNLTTIEQLGQKRRTMFLAVNISSGTHTIPPPPTLQPERDVPSPWVTTITYPLYSKSSSSPSSSASSLAGRHPRRTFAVLKTREGMNPWDVSPFKNFAAVMGDHRHDWLLPVKMSPLCRGGGESMYDLGPDFETLTRQAGFLPLDEVSGSG